MKSHPSSPVAPSAGRNRHVHTLPFLICQLFWKYEEVNQNTLKRLDDLQRYIEKKKKKKDLFNLRVSI